MGEGRGGVGTVRTKNGVSGIETACRATAFTRALLYLVSHCLLAVVECVPYFIKWR